MKTNKALLKRLKLTRRGKLLHRSSGQNHFNAKASRRRQLAGKRLLRFLIKNKPLSRYLPNLVK